MLTWSFYGANELVNYIKSLSQHHLSTGFLTTGVDNLLLYISLLPVLSTLSTMYRVLTYYSIPIAAWDYYNWCGVRVLLMWVVVSLMLGITVANIVYNCSLCHRAPNAVRSDGERNLIGWRTESDRMADGIWSDGERNPITKHDVSECESVY